MSRILLIDGNSILNRAFYGIKNLSTKDGKHTNAVFGFMTIFLKQIQNEQPDYVAVAFDLPGGTFRNRMYPDYKGTRKGMPEDLAEQLPYTKDLLTYLGYAVVTCPDYEADDILGTLSRRASEEGVVCRILTGDRDSLQLVDSNTVVLYPSTSMGRTETTLMDEAAVKEKYGVTPSEIIDLKALMGDSSDNIPGVPGVGEKTATMLISSFHSIEGVYENIDDPSIKKAVREHLINGKESAYTARQL
ncbi:MAG: DNA polymerase I, partial [Oscillospiraceae bacterium]|nr:DNA polymerase I [Oscillospiraceae bacterium]